jgi:hypothetical protein
MIFCEIVLFGHVVLLTFFHIFALKASETVHWNSPEIGGLKNRRAF